MIIEKVDPGREAFSDYSLEETILTVGGIEVDLAAEQGDQETIVTFASCNGTVHRGMMPCCEYVADVIIPPRKYDLVEVENENGGNEKGNEEPATHTESVPVLLDLDSVILRLWPVTAQSENEEQGVMSC
jgi:hypothetical protein